MTIAEDRSLRDDISFVWDHGRVSDTQETLTPFARAVLARGDGTTVEPGAL